MGVGQNMAMNPYGNPMMMGGPAMGMNGMGMNQGMYQPNMMMMGGPMYPAPSPALLEINQVRMYQQQHQNTSSQPSFHQ